MTPVRSRPSPQAVVGGIFNLLAGTLGVLGWYGSRQLELMNPMPVFIPGTMLLTGVLYLLAGVALLLPWRDAFHLGRAFLILGIVANIALLIGGASVLPEEIVQDYPLAVPVPSLLVGLMMLEVIVLFWPEGSEENPSI